MTAWILTLALIVFGGNFTLIEPPAIAQAHERILDGMKFYDNSAKYPQF